MDELVSGGDGLREKEMGERVFKKKGKNNDGPLRA